MSVVNIIIPFYKNKETIDNLLESIFDQDYKDYSIYIIIDGKDDSARNYIIKTHKKHIDDKLLFVEMPFSENKGAAEARNYGAQISMNDLLTDNADNILFFIDADCQLYPGMLRECVEQLEDNPDIDFVYGDYRFEHKQEFYAQEFDQYQLSCMNYVSTMSPMRRRAFDKIGGFRLIEYFQDWSLFYDMVKAGSKGKYINEFIFSTKKPEEFNISGTKGLTLADKVKEFRSRHSIPTRSMVVTTFGAPLQAMHRSEMLGADYFGSTQGRRAIYPPNMQFPCWKATYVVGCYNETIEALGNHLALLVGRPIFHFIGTDVFQMFNNHSMAALSDFATEFKRIDAVLLANSQRSVDRLKQCGFDVELVYTPIYQIERYKVLTNLPEKFTVAVYFSNTNPMHALDGSGGRSNLPLIMDVAKSTPDIHYKFFGGHEKYIAKDILRETPENIEFCGKIDYSEMPEFINSCSMVLRSTVHDGFPQLPIQFLLCGRQALVSYPGNDLHYTNQLSFEDVLDYEKCKDEMINKIYDAQKIGDKDFKNNAVLAKSYYNEIFDIGTYRNKIYGCIR